MQSKKLNCSTANICSSLIFKHLFFLCCLVSAPGFGQDYDSLVSYRHRFAGDRMDYTLKAYVRQEKLNGPIEIRNPKGELVLEGNYFNNRKKGSWKKYATRNGEKVLLEDWSFEDPMHPVLLSKYDTTTGKSLEVLQTFDISGDSLPLAAEPKFSRTLIRQLMPGVPPDAFTEEELHNLTSRLFNACVNARLFPFDTEGNALIARKDAPLSSKKPLRLLFRDIYYVNAGDGLRRLPEYIGFVLNDKSECWFQFSKIQRHPGFTIDLPFIESIRSGALSGRVYRGLDPDGKPISRNEQWKTQALECMFDLVLMESILWK